MKYLLLCLLLFAGSVLFAQNVAINEDGSDPDASAVLDVSSASKGMLVPRMTTSQRNAISSPATGLVVFDSDFEAFYFYSGSTWRTMEAAVSGSSSDDVPASPYTGQLYYDTSGEQLYVYGNSGWLEVTLGTASSSPY